MYVCMYHQVSVVSSQLLLWNMWRFTVLLVTCIGYFCSINLWVICPTTFFLYLFPRIYTSINLPLQRKKKKKKKRSCVLFSQAEVPVSWRALRLLILSISTLSAALRFLSSSKSFVSPSISRVNFSSILLIASSCFLSILAIISRSSTISFRSFSTSPDAVVKGSTFWTGGTGTSSFRDFRFSSASVLDDRKGGGLK